MNLKEMWEKSPSAYQDLGDDNSRTKMKQLRSTRLTLKQIKKLRLMNDLRSVEKQEELEFVRKMYAPPPAAA